MNPSAPVLADGDSASVWYEQTHAIRETHTTQFSDFHPQTLSVMQRLQEWQNRPFDAAVFAGYAQPRYDATISTVSKDTVFGSNPAPFGATAWTFEVRQRWSDGEGADIQEFWETNFIVRLSRALDPERDYTKPWTDADLASFLDGFEEAGGTVSVTPIAGFADFTGNRQDWAVWLEGDFHIASATQPIPEPTSVALLASGLGLIAWRLRGDGPGEAKAPQSRSA